MLQNRRYRKPDPLLLLAVLVGLAVLASTASYAAAAPSRDLQRNSGQSAESSSGFTHRAYRELVEDGVMNVAEIGAKGPRVGLALRQPPSLRQALAAGGDPGTGRIRRREASVYVTFGTRW
ncbi:MAG: hypothetical protein P8124_00385 [Gammaproteobacteria bacterium]